MPLQVLDATAKSVTLAPVIETLLIVAATVPVFCKVTVLGLLVVPTDWLLNVRDVGETDSEVWPVTGVGDGVGIIVVVGVALGIIVVVGVALGAIKLSFVSAL